MEKQRILAVFGTRPEAIKLCPLIRELNETEEIVCRVCVTGQHRELLTQVLSLFGVIPDYDLSLMREGQPLHQLTGRILEGVREILIQERPTLVLVHGDTSSAFGAALAAFYCRIPVGHVEAGLRSGDLLAPFPEEWNRRAIGILAERHYAPTARARENLLREGVPSGRIVVTGNTGLDALRYTVQTEFTHPYLEWAEGSRLLLVTAHRRENLGEPMRRMLRGIKRVVEEFPDVKALYPVHPNPEVRRVAEEVLGECERIRLVEHLDTVPFHNILARSYLALTDSGGIQEEAPALGKPVLLMRKTTERPEGTEAGVMRLIGTGEGSVYRGVRELLENDALYHVMSHAPNPYGDGYASRRIAEDLMNTVRGAF